MPMSKGVKFMPLRLLFIICSIGLTAASAQVPQLSVVSATSKQVQLTWTAVPGASYSVYRVPLHRGRQQRDPGFQLEHLPMPVWSQPIATVNGTRGTDSTVL